MCTCCECDSRPLGVVIGQRSDNVKKDRRRLGFSIHVAQKDFDNIAKGDLLLVRVNDPSFVIQTRPPKPLVEKGYVLEETYRKYIEWFDNLKEELINSASSLEDLFILGYCVGSFRIQQLEWSWIVKIANPIIEAYSKLESEK